MQLPFARLIRAHESPAGSVDSWVGSPDAKRCADILAHGIGLGEIEAACDIAFGSSDSAISARHALETIASTRAPAVKAPKPGSWEAGRAEREAVPRRSGRDQLLARMAAHDAREASKAAKPDGDGFTLEQRAALNALADVRAKFPTLPSIDLRLPPA